MLSEKSAPVEGEGGGLKAKLAAKFKKRPDDSPEKKKQQLQDYTAWVNNYLRRKPGAPLVSDLRWSLGDGVTFIHLVEIVARAQVAGVERWPSTVEGQRLNTERALEFLRGDGVVLHPDACRDLLEGNVKGVMRVILAIAERYQPKSVKPRAAVDTFTARPLNHTAPVTDVALHSRPDLMRPYTHPQTGRPEQGQILSQSAGFHSSMYPSSYAVDPAQEGMYSCPIDQLPANKPPQVISGKKKAPPVVRGRTTSVGVAGMYGIPEESTEEWEGPVTGGVVRGDGLSGEIVAVVAGLGQFKAELLQLHAILLRNNDGTRDVGGAGTEGEVGMAVQAGVREKELEAETVSLRDQLSHLQDECTQAEAECGALRSMVEERNAFITTMKSEIYRKEYLNDTQKAELHTQLLQKDTHIKTLEADLADCRSNLEARESELGGVRNDLEQSRADIEQRNTAAEQSRAEVERLQSELGKMAASEEKLGQKLAARDKRLAAAEERVSEERERGNRHMQQLSQDLETLAEALAQLTCDPGQAEQLEEVRRRVGDMARLLEQPLPSSPGRRRRKESEEHSRQHRRKRRSERPQAAEPHPPTTLNTTRVLYYMAGDSKTDVPFVAIVPKKANEVTLGDFKAAFGRHGDFRFFFKTEDPDCGVVKEELMSDDHILPNLKGKVTAWIREREVPAPTPLQ